MKNKLLYLLMFLLYASVVSSQEYFNLNFNIYDKEDNQPVDGIYVSIVGTDFITVSDELGNVKINKVPIQFVENKLFLNSLQYRDTAIFLGLKLKNIFLEPNNSLLSEVEIIYQKNNKKNELKALKIIEKSLIKLDSNLYTYSNSLFGKYTYLNTIENKNDTLRFSKGTSNFALPPFLNAFQISKRSKSVIKIEKDKRRQLLPSILGEETKVEQLLPLPYDLEYISFMMLSGDMQNNYPLSYQKIGGYDYLIADTVLIGGVSYFKINYTPKSFGKNKYKGYLLVNTIDYGIREINSNLIFSDRNNDVTIISGIKENKKIFYAFNQKNITISFEKVKEKYRLLKVEAQLSFNIISKKDNIDSDRFLISYQVVNFKENLSEIQIPIQHKKKSYSKIKKALSKKIIKLQKEIEL